VPDGGVAEECGPGRVRPGPQCGCQVRRASWRRCAVGGKVAIRRCGFDARWPDRSACITSLSRYVAEVTVGGAAPYWLATYRSMAAGLVAASAARSAMVRQGRAGPVEVMAGTRMRQ
jgi:hypothetical protein